MWLHCVSTAWHNTKCQFPWWTRWYQMVSQAPANRLFQYPNDSFWKASQALFFMPSNLPCGSSGAGSDQRSIVHFECERYCKWAFPKVCVRYSITVTVFHCPVADFPAPNWCKDERPWLVLRSCRLTSVNGSVAQSVKQWQLGTSVKLWCCSQLLCSQRIHAKVCYLCHREVYRNDLSCYANSISGTAPWFAVFFMSWNKL